MCQKRCIDPVGYDAARKIKDEKRHGAIDELAVLGVAVALAARRTAIGSRAPEGRASTFSIPRRPIVDGGY
jgi:hypothetical protein